jgi:ribosomal protein S27AE
MTIIKTCPECGNSLSTNNKRCSCGWQKQEGKTREIADLRCTYVISEKRCPLPGTMSPYSHGSGRWYCRRHYKTLDDPRLGEAELRYINKNFQNIIETEYQDWREKLFN